jgi:hypothetical protein
MPKYSEIKWNKAACQSESTNVFYSFEESRAVKKLINIDVFRNICAPCPIWRDCLRYSLEYEFYGIWGGLTGEERVALRNGRFTPMIEKLMIDFEIRGISPTEFIEIVSEYQINLENGSSASMINRKRQLGRTSA